MRSGVNDGRLERMAAQVAEEHRAEQSHAERSAELLRGTEQPGRSPGDSGRDRRQNNVHQRHDEQREAHAGHSERVLAILRAGGLSPRLAVQGYLLLTATVKGFTIDETGLEGPDPAEPGGAGADAKPGNPASPQQAADFSRDYIASLPRDLFPTMTSLADEFAFSDADERFELLIDIFIDGLARRGRR